MQITFTASVLFVKDISISKFFYCNLLHQEIEHDFGNNIIFKSGLALWQITKNHILNDSFHKSDDLNKSLELYFETENIAEVVEFIDQNSIQKQHDLLEESWGQKTIRFYDPDKNLIEIGESLKTFVKRMFNEGLSVDQINKKSGVPTSLIEEYIK